MIFLSESDQNGLHWDADPTKAGRLTTAGKVEGSRGVQLVLSFQQYQPRSPTTITAFPLVNSVFAVAISIFASDHPHYVPPPSVAIVPFTPHSNVLLPFCPYVSASTSQNPGSRQLAESPLITISINHSHVCATRRRSKTRQPVFGYSAILASRHHEGYASMWFLSHIWELPGDAVESK